MMKLAQPGQTDRGFTLVEVIIALVILGIGVIALLRLFPTGVQRAAEAERITRATLLAQEILEGIKAQGGAGIVTVIPGADIGIPEPVPMPGDGVDNDEDGYLPTGSVHPFVDINGNGQIDADYDGLPEQDYAGRLCRGGFMCITSDVADGVDNDLDGVVDDDGDSNLCRYNRPLLRQGLDVPQLPDGDFNYDPEMNIVGGFLRGADEEYPDGIDNDPDPSLDGIDINGDGTVDLRIDEDVRLAANFRNGLWWPLEPGDNVDNDNDDYVEENSPLDPNGFAVADGLDNDGDGLIDEGIDEEIYNGLDDDGDGRIDEDCRASSYPFTTRKFFRARYVDDDGDGLFDEDPANSRDDDGDGQIDEDRPNDTTDQFAWQIIVGRVPDGGGDGINNDGDSLSGIAKIDEELRDGLNDDPQCGGGGVDFDLLVDEDCMAAPVRGFRRVTVRITWNGDGDRNGDGYPGEFGVDDDGDGEVDFDDPDVEAGMVLDAAILGIPVDEIKSNPILLERWAQDDDEDGRIDEEKLNGIDDDLDGRIDEDVSTGEFNLTGFVQL